MNITKITVGKGSCGLAAGAATTERVLFEEILSNVPIVPVGCIGMCRLEPIVDLYYDDGSKETYVNVTDKVARDIAKHVNKRQNNTLDSLIKDEDLTKLNRQTRFALKNCGVINPEAVDEYIERGGYDAFKKAMDNSPEWVIDAVKRSGLAGRGGAGFPTWFKWNAARSAVGDKKYVICNADEGDPGAFMDRAVIEGDPHAVIEGMLIAAYAIGASEGFVYVRAEYPLAIARLNIAIKQARDYGFLGKPQPNGFVFDLNIKAGAGAFVCGEETALIASLMGERGMPTLKPPFPAERGFESAPSNINNVETYANVPAVISDPDSFAAIGSETSKGTKVFALTGKIKDGGLVEVPMGITLRDVIFDFGGGIRDDKAFKAVQTGGPSGGCIPASLLDTPIGYKELAATGAIMGSGGMVVMDESTCMVEMARFFLDFTRKESCGKCTQCRIGSTRMLEILTRITEGNGTENDIETLEDIGRLMKDGALCGLGQTAPNPVLTALKYFKDEFHDHIHNKKCTAKSCKALINYSITAEACKSCGLCARKCPSNAITGERGVPYIINTDDCVKCGACERACKFGAVVVD